MHGHCHHKSLLRFDQEGIDLLKRAGVECKVLDSGAAEWPVPLATKLITTKLGWIVANVFCFRLCGGAPRRRADYYRWFQLPRDDRQETDRRALHFAQVFRWLARRPNRTQR